jgi:hypothetical protein
VRHGYDRLAEIAERELALVEAGELDALAGLQRERRELVAALPAIPPRDAHPALERAAAIQGRVTALLEERLAETGGELSKLGTGRRAIRSYAVPERGRLVDRAG